MIRQEFEQALAIAQKAGIGTTRQNGRIACREDVLASLETILTATDSEEMSLLYATAARIRDETSGKRMHLRGLVEFSSICCNTCHYCGLNRTNTALERYRLDKDEIMQSIHLIMHDGIQTVVLQSGEDGRPAEWLADIVRSVREESDMAITLSVGERSKKDYALWRRAGADRYLLRIESSDSILYQSLHSGRRLETRLRCLDDLRALGYQVGSGIMVGVKGQTQRHIAEDILFFAEREMDMIGIGPFIPHPDTILGTEPAGSLAMTLKTVALTRIVTRNAWMPATTALGSLDRDYRVDALRAGANVIMPNYTPALFKKQYEIYPGKRCVTEKTGACAGCMDRLAQSAGLVLDLTRADSLKAIR